MSSVKRRRRSLEVHSRTSQKVLTESNNLRKNIYQPLLAKHRSFRGSLTSRIKDALYTIFPELPSITSNSPPSEIWQWKSNPIVASCHNKLFKKIVVEEPTTFMSKILDRLFPSKK